MIINESISILQDPESIWEYWLDVGKNSIAYFQVEADSKVHPSLQL